MSAAITPERLELCRIVREHCYQAVAPMAHIPQDEIVVELAETALDTSIEVMAGWFMMDETVLANIRLAMSMVAESVLR